MIFLLKICLIGLTSVILITLVKVYKPELSIEITICASIVMLIMIIDGLKGSFQYIIDIYNNLNTGKEYFPIILKVLGIAYVTEFAVALCQDAGEKTIASKSIVFPLPVGPVIKKRPLSWNCGKSTVTQSG